MGSIPTEDTVIFGISPRQINARTWKYRVYNEWAFLSPSSVIKSEYLRECSASRVLALYASALNHAFGQMLGLPGSWVCRLTFHYYRLRWPKENYCDCALVILDEHLSRESRKLTVMIQRETGQPLDDLLESLGFLRINEGPFPGHVHTCPYPDAREGTRGYIIAPPSNSYG